MAKKSTGITGPDGVPIKRLRSSNDFLDCSELWVGGPGTGKTSTGSALGSVAESLGLEGVNPFFMWFERGHTLVEVDGTTQACPDCAGKGCGACGDLGVVPLVLGPDKMGAPLATMDKWFDWVAKSEFNPVFIDTGNAYHLAISEGVSMRKGVKSPSEANDHGATWTQLFNQTRDYHALIRSSGKSLIYIMHVFERVKRLSGGAEITEMVSHISGASGNFLKGSAEQILHFDIVPGGKDEPSQGIIHCTPSAGLEAKDRWGILPDEIDRGTTPEEGAEALLKCFYDFEE